VIARRTQHPHQSSRHDEDRQDCESTDSTAFRGGILRTLLVHERMGDFTDDPPSAGALIAYTQLRAHSNFETACFLRLP
jgi:hypothetical protein